MDMVEKGTVLVFPTEESARVFSVEYVARRGKGLLASSVVAFDRFASIFMPGSAGRKAALGAERILFSEYAASVLSPHMCYFSSPGYPPMSIEIPFSMIWILRSRSGIRAAVVAYSTCACW